MNEESEKTSTPVKEEQQKLSWKQLYDNLLAAQATKENLQKQIAEVTDDKILEVETELSLAKIALAEGNHEFEIMRAELKDYLKKHQPPYDFVPYYYSDGGCKMIRAKDLEGEEGRMALYEAYEKDHNSESNESENSDPGNQSAEEEAVTAEDERSHYTIDLTSKSESKRESKTDSKPGSKRESQTDSKPGSKRESQTDSKRDSKTDAQTDLVPRKESAKSNFSHKSNHNRKSNLNQDAEEDTKLDNEADFKKNTAFLLGNKSTEKIKEMRSPSIMFKDRNDFYSEEGDHSEEDLAIWEQDILPRIERKVEQDKLYAKVKVLINEFIPSKYRYSVWKYLIGNSLRIRKQMYEEVKELQKAHPFSARVAHLLQVDIDRTYTFLNASQEGEVFKIEMQAIVHAFQFMRPDLGYVQGMNYPISMLLMHMDQYRAFKCFTNLVYKSKLLFTLYRINPQTLAAIYRIFECLLEDKLPTIFQYLAELNIRTDMYLLEWFYTVYARAFPGQIVAKIWDCFLFYGDSVLFNVALAILSLTEKILLQQDFEGMLKMLRSETMTLDQKALMKLIRNQMVSPERFERLWNKEMSRIPEK